MYLLISHYTKEPSKTCLTPPRLQKGGIALDATLSLISLILALGIVLASLKVPLGPFNALGKATIFTAIPLILAPAVLLGLDLFLSSKKEEKKPKVSRNQKPTLPMLPVIQKYINNSDHSYLCVEDDTLQVKEGDQNASFETILRFIDAKRDQLLEEMALLKDNRPELIAARDRIKKFVLLAHEKDPKLKKISDFVCPLLTHPKYNALLFHPYQIVKEGENYTASGLGESGDLEITIKKEVPGTPTHRGYGDLCFGAYFQDNPDPYGHITLNSMAKLTEEEIATLRREEKESVTDTYGTLGVQITDGRPFDRKTCGSTHDLATYGAEKTDGLALLYVTRLDNYAKPHADYHVGTPSMTIQGLGSCLMHVACLESLLSPSFEGRLALESSKTSHVFYYKLGLRDEDSTENYYFQKDIEKVASGIKKEYDSSSGHLFYPSHSISWFKLFYT